MKGVGPYTATAMMTFAFRMRTFPIDTVIRRVTGRLLLGVLFPQPKKDAALRKTAEHFLPKRGKFYDVPQALSDLGAAVCKKILRARPLPHARILQSRAAIPLRPRAHTKNHDQKSNESHHRDKPFPDRIYRGRIMRLACESLKGVSLKVLGNIVDLAFDQTRDTVWLATMVARLQKDGLVAIKQNRLRLPSYFGKS